MDNLEKFLKVGDKIRFDCDSDDLDLDDFLAEKGLYYMSLTIKEIDLDNGLFWIENIPYAISINDNFEIVKFEKLQEKIEELENNRYVCYSVKELAYRIMDEFIDDGQDYFIDYKLVQDRKNHYTHKIAFMKDNFYMIFDIVWSSNALIIADNYIVDKLDDDFEDIESAIDDDEE